MNAPNPCPADPVLAAFTQEELSGEQTLAVARHLGACRECREQAVDLRAVHEAATSLAAGEAVRWHVFESPFGPTFVARTDRGLARLSWTRDQEAGSFRRELEDRFPDRPVIRDPGSLEEVQRELEEYFSGSRSAFEVPVDLSTVSDFERRVLRTLRSEVSFGEVVPYGELARRIGRPGAARAVGNALGKNPVAIVVPCHRVIRTDGSLGGYTGGLEFKRRLLTIEGREELARSA